MSRRRASQRRVDENRREGITRRVAELRTIYIATRQRRDTHVL